MDESDKHCENARMSRDESFEPRSNVTVERDVHSAKQSRQMVSTEDGIRIDERDAHNENAP